MLQADEGDGIAVAGGGAPALGLPVLRGLQRLIRGAAGKGHAVGIFLRVFDRLRLRHRRIDGGRGRRAIGMGRPCRRKQGDHDRGRNCPQGLLHSDTA